MIGLLLVELLALLFVCSSLFFEFVALVSEDTAGNSTYGSTDEGSFGGLIFVVMADDSSDHRAGDTADDGSISGVFLSVGFAQQPGMGNR
jgi:hypothetical protein